MSHFPVLAHIPCPKAIKIDEETKKSIKRELKKILWKYDGCQLPNFICDFCVPVYNDLLMQRIKEWRVNPKLECLNRIHAIVKCLGGNIFIWA